MTNLTEEPEDPYKVPNLEKGLNILELLATTNRYMTLQEIKTQSATSQTTTYRILNTLVKLGYLLYNSNSKKYKLSQKMLTLGLKGIHEDSILEVVLPKMRELRNIVKETVFFGVMGDEKGLFIEQVLGSYPFCFILAAGKQFDLHCSAPGKAMMAFMSEHNRNDYFSKMNYQVFNNNTIKSQEQYLKELKKVKKAGYALDLEEELYGVICIGAPIFNYTNEPCGSIWISGPKDRLPKETISVYAQEIISATNNISLELGYDPSKIENRK